MRNHLKHALMRGAAGWTLLSAGATAALLLTGASASAANASTSTAATNSTTVEDVVVTARRREERLQDVPIAVTVMSTELIRDRGIKRGADLEKVTPGLYVGNNFSGIETPTFVMRGQRQSLQTPATDASIGIYLNDMVLAETQGVNTLIYDMENVQVLKGPQGTLFGRNTPGGAILYTTKHPSDHYEGYVDGTVGTYKDVELEGGVTLPVNEQLSIRLAGRFQSDEGYIKNFYNNSHLDDDHVKAVRASVRWKPMDWLTNDFVGSYSDYHSHGTAYKLILVTQTGPFGATSLQSNIAGGLAGANALLAAETANFFSASDDGALAKNTNVVFSNTTTAELGTVTLKNILGYRWLNAQDHYEIDGSPLPIFNGMQALKGDQYSDEVQALGTLLDKKVDYIVGGFLYREVSRFRQGQFDVVPVNQLLLTEGYNRIRTDSQAVFAQATYHLPAQFNFTAGIRQTWDQRTMTSTNYGTVAPGSLPNTICKLHVDNTPTAAIDNPCVITTPNSSNALTYNLTLDWKPVEGVMVYATKRRGYRAGGVNLGPGNTKPLDYAVYAPEFVNDLEIGAKTSWHFMETSGHFNVAYYHDNYTNIQRLVSKLATLPGGLVVSLSQETNAASARINGYEVEGNWRLTQWLDLSAFYSETHPKYTTPFFLGTFDNSVSTFGGIPHYLGGGTVTVFLPRTPIGTPKASFSGFHSSESFNNEQQYTATGAFRPTTQIPGYTLYDAHAQIDQFLGKDLSLGVTVKNLTNVKSILSGNELQSSFGIVSGQPGAPRTVTVDLRYEF